MDVNFDHVPCIAVVVKHGNACGASIGDTTEEALKNMILGDPIAVFGGVVMTNFSIGKQELNILRTYAHDGPGKYRFLSGIAAPKIYTGANKALSKSTCFLLENSALASLTRDSLDTSTLIRPVRGGFLEQPNHTFVLDLDEREVQHATQLSGAQRCDVVLAWAVGSTSTSNTITIVRCGMLLGNGTGQQDRVKAAELAVERAVRSDHNTDGATAYSDSFFPFEDGPEVLVKAGISVVFASSGSQGDKNVQKFCADAGIIFVTLPDSMCRGFYGH